MHTASRGALKSCGSLTRRHQQHYTQILSAPIRFNYRFNYRGSRSRRNTDLCTASQGFGKADRSKGDSKLSHEAKKGKGGSTVRIEPNNLLKIFFESPDKDAVAEEHEASLSEKFFIVLDSFMGLASKEGNEAVISALKQTLEAAMQVKQRSLRPEIQLLNSLLADKSFEDRAVRLSSAEALNTLQMNDGYFFQLLGMMTNDAKQSSGNAHSSSTLQRLNTIEKECTVRLESSKESQT